MVEVSIVPYVYDIHEKTQIYTSFLYANADGGQTTVGKSGSKRKLESVSNLSSASVGKSTSSYKQTTIDFRKKN